MYSRNVFVLLKVMFEGQKVLCNGDDNEKGDESSLKKQIKGTTKNSKHCTRFGV